MRKKPTVGLLLLVALLGLSGCYSTTGTMTRDPVSYLLISKSREGLTVAVDELAPVPVVTHKGQARVQVAPGRHRVRVLQNGTVLVDRTILVSDLQTIEITVP